MVPKITCIETPSGQLILHCLYWMHAGLDTKAILQRIFATMPAKQPRTEIELIVSIGTLTISLIGFFLNWNEIRWLGSFAPLLFIPLFLASVYSLLNWFGFEWKLEHFHFSYAM
ncbi:MAG: hypothetical protein AAF664_18205 [Planctomycetota bacterium]